jgi:organic radical activating enzyme
MTRKIINSSYYCSQKFWWLTVNLERKNISSCCSASPHPVDIKWLKQNPEKIFNTSELLQERKDMLNGVRVASCEDTCWTAEDRSAISRRISMNSQPQTHTNIVAKPDVLNIILSTDCNMTCVYCCKQYSSAWYKDIKTNGSYLEDARYTINNQDRIIEEIGQKQLKNSQIVGTLLDSIQQLDNLRLISITGGEPFLYNGLIELVNNFADPIEIHTGLGVSPARFSAILDKLPSNVSIIISGESTEKFYEFVRYGNSYQNFLVNLESIKQRNISYRFSITMSNLTIFGYREFEDQFGQDNNVVQFCNDPDYLAVGVMDPESIAQLKSIDYKWNDLLIKTALNTGYSNKQKLNFVTYLKEFVSRRNLALDIFPTSFINWINQS